MLYGEHSARIVIVACLVIVVFVGRSKTKHWFPAASVRRGALGKRERIIELFM